MPRVLALTQAVADIPGQLTLFADGSRKLVENKAHLIKLIKAYKDLYGNDWTNAFARAIVEALTPSHPDIGQCLSDLEFHYSQLFINEEEKAGRPVGSYV